MPSTDIFISLIKESLSLGILLPIVWYFLKEQNKTLKSGFELLGGDIKELGQNLKDLIQDHEQREIIEIQTVKKSLDTHEKNAEIRAINSTLKMGNTVLNKEQSISMLLSKMWIVSYGKVMFIKQILINNHIKGREEQVKNKIKAELSSRSQEYMKDFTQFTTPIGDLSLWLERNFTEKEFDKFLNDIYEIVFRQNNNELDGLVNIEIKVNEIFDLMKTLQNQLAEKLRKDLENNKI